MITLNRQEIEEFELELEISLEEIGIIEQTNIYHPFGSYEELMMSVNKILGK